MTMGGRVTDGMRRVSDMVRELIPRLRATLTPEEGRLAVHLRGNTELYEAITNVVRARIRGRSFMTEPDDPVVCKSMLARDRELQWLLGKLEFIYRSPLQSEEDGEPPAA